MSHSQSKKIAIINRHETVEKCIGKGCLRAFFTKADSFERYADQEIELVAFCHDGGPEDDPLANLRLRIEKLKKYEVDTVHVSTCIRGKNPLYHKMMELLSEHFEVVGYTHGSEDGKDQDGEK